MIETMLYRVATAAVDCGDEALLAQWQPQSGDLLWVNLHGNDPAEEARLLAGTFGLHRLAIQDAQRARHQPKLEQFSDYDFLLLKGLGPDSPQFEFVTIQIAMFIGQRFFVTRHSGPSPSIALLRSTLQADPTLLSEGSDALALELSRISVDRYINRLMTLEPRLERLEDEIVERPDDSILAELMGYKTDLRKFRRVLLYHVQIFTEMLGHPSPRFHPERRHHLKDVFEHMERANSLATLYFEMASDLADGYLSLASHRLNNIMKVLTIVTAIFVPLSFLAGVYGMNFDQMPELKSRYGYFVLLGFMAAVAVSLLVVFRRKRWL